MRRGGFLFLLLAVLLAPSMPAAAQTVVTSAGPDHVAVTVYRQPHRSRRSAIDLDQPHGYALITEQRTIELPAGRGTIRFEGVAGGILPESAIVRGLPDGVLEKNLDADLLSPGALYDRGFSRPVTLRRRRSADEAVVEEPAIIRSGLTGAAILETRRGIEVADCGPTSDSIVYDAVPAGLSARPTLSIATESPHGGKVTVTLSYLAWGFDWQANYVATLHDDGRTADLFAWVTLASGDRTSFVDAETSVVAGRLDRTSSADDIMQPSARAFELHCYLRARTPPSFASKIVTPSPQVVMNSPEMLSREEIVVTGSRIADHENLGDLKLYRVPEPTTVAARSQKQVAMLDQRGVPVALVYRSKLYGDEASPVSLLLRTQNRADHHLGVPLPAGPVAVFDSSDGRRLLVGEGGTDDKAVGEDINIEAADATQVTAELELVSKRDKQEDYLLTVRNGHATPVTFEGEFHLSESIRLKKLSARIGKRFGQPIWVVEVPANGSVELRYRLQEIDD
jgi:hypothetical protein